MNDASESVKLQFGALPWMINFGYRYLIREPIKQHQYLWNTSHTIISLW